MNKINFCIYSNFITFEEINCDLMITFVNILNKCNNELTYSLL